MITNNKGVAFIRNEISSKLSQWDLIRDCLEGEQIVKKKGVKYLPYPSTNAVTENCDNDTRYIAYRDRAVFLNVTRRTIYELLAQVFIRKPVLRIVDNEMINLLVDNASGNGVDLQQCAKQSLQYAISYAYGGVLVDFPQIDGAISVKDFNNGVYRPTITPYSPFSIRNFRVEDFGAEERLTLVVLQESYYEYDNDGFEVKQKDLLRVLRLKNGVYTQTIYKDKSNGINKHSSYEKGETITPTDANGNTLNYIPFYFIGMENNNPYPDNPIMYDLASLNIAHYRNSADYEHTMFIAGQATLFVSGLSGNSSNIPSDDDTPVIKLGSEHAINLKNGGTAGLLQAKADSGLAESMEKKEKQMCAFGAKFLETDNVAKTAYQVKVENPSQGSVLANCADNVSKAYTLALKTAHRICGLDDKDVLFELNTDFEYNRVGSDEQQFYITAWTQGALTFEEMRACLHRGGSASVDDEVAKKQIDEERAKAQKEQLALNKANQNVNENKGADK